MKKSVFFWLYFIVSIILAIYFTTRIITSQMGRGPISNIKHIFISSDSSDTNLDAIRVAVGINKGTNIRSVDLHQINNRVLAVPGVKKSSTRRLANGDIVIKTEQHNVVAMWTDGVSYYPLSSDGTKIDTPLNERDENTLVFRGELPTDVIKIVNAVSPISDYIDYVSFIESRRWNIHTKNGTTIYLPEDNPSVAINKISVLNQTHKLLSRKLEILDMRDSARILVKTKK